MQERRSYYCEAGTLVRRAVCQGGLGDLSNDFLSLLK